MLVIDAANVIGSRPDGWWRDRAGAAARFVARVRRAVDEGRIEPPVTVVVEGRSRAGAAEGVEDGVEVVHAPAEGDDTIVLVVGRSDGPTVVTADRELSSRARDAGAVEVVGPTWLLDRLSG